MDDAQRVRIQNLKKQKEELIPTIQSLLSKRRYLNDSLQESGLTNVQIGYLRNLFFKKQMEIEILNGKGSDKRREKILDYKDWAIQFLKEQVEKRDNLMTEQLSVLDGNNIANRFSYDGLRKVKDLPQDLKQGSDFTLPPLFPDRVKRKKSVIHSQSGPIVPRLGKLSKLPGVANGNRGPYSKADVSRIGQPSRYSRPGQNRGYGGGYGQSRRNNYNKNMFNRYREQSVNKYYKGNPKRDNSVTSRGIGNKYRNYRGYKSKAGSVSSSRGEQSPRRRGYNYARSRKDSVINRSLNLSEKSFSTAPSNQQKRYGQVKSRINSGNSRFGHKPYFGVQRPSPYADKYVKKQPLGQQRKRMGSFDKRANNSPRQKR